MKFMSFVREGFRIAGRHKKLVLVLWLAPLVPAIILAAMVASNLAPALGGSVYAGRVLSGDWFVVFQEFRASPADALGPILSLGVAVMAALTLLLQVMLSAGVVEVVLERTPINPFVLGIRKNFLRFLRTTILLTGATVAAIFAARLLMRGFFKIAEAQGDGRFDLFGVVLAAVLFFLVWAPLDLAADFSRIAAARHDQRSMVRGFFRALKTVLGRPGLLAPLYLVFLVLPLLVHVIYYQLRSPWSAATAATILVSLVLQQAVMLARSLFKLGFWGAEVAVYRDLHEPELCRSKNPTGPIEEPSASVPETHEVVGVSEARELRITLSE
jgi:hypothetical protein